MSEIFTAVQARSIYPHDQPITTRKSLVSTLLRSLRSFRSSRHASGPIGSDSTEQSDSIDPNPTHDSAPAENTATQPIQPTSSASWIGTEAPVSVYGRGLTNKFSSADKTHCPDADMYYNRASAMAGMTIDKVQSMYGTILSYIPETSRHWWTSKVTDLGEQLSHAGEWTVNQTGTYTKDVFGVGGWFDKIGKEIPATTYGTFCTSVLACREAIYK
jgi:hypothetical protein